MASGWERGEGCTNGGQNGRMCLIGSEQRNTTLPAKDRYHDTVKRALTKDGWRVTAEQVRLTFGDRYFWIDIQAENLEQRIILIEVKELDDVDSPVEALAEAVGKYLLYRLGLAYTQQNIPLFLAVTEASYTGILSAKMGQAALNQFQISLVIFDPEQEVITKWIP
jgi:hypothetical protein